MRANHPNKLPGSLVSALFAVVVIAGSLGQAFADSKPYFVTRGSDVFTGGWYNNGVSSCAAANYQSPQNPAIATNKNYYGGIMGFADASGSRTGASSDLGAFSLGNIEADQAPTALYGFYTGPAGAGPANNGTRSLSFANSGAGINSNTNWGGLFEGAFSQSNCIPDYFGTKQNTSPVPSGSFPGISSADGQYLVGGSPYTLGGGSVGVGKNVALFVNGDLYITGNIDYATPYTASTSPKFVVVVKGDIYVGPGVSKLEGWYIAQPNGANKGAIWTCVDPTDPNGSPTPSGTKDTWVRSNCGNQLSINGALTAAQVNLGRINDGLGSANPGNAAEVVNFIPEMVIGGPFFNPPNTINAPIQSLISLPPVF